MTIEPHWVEFAEGVKRDDGQTWDAYPQSLSELKKLWLPPKSVIKFLEKYAADNGGMSKEAATWLRRVKRVYESETVNVDERIDE